MVFITFVSPLCLLASFFHSQNESVSIACEMALIYNGHIKQKNVKRCTKKVYY
ncbi:hypothetical protein HMPREF1250_1915 [Megasphaera vaginalis (ex Srinivasan et al. 2021)]|uniref:Uncharacterized protein n=1 Tax=Megasphaera vaginalis (ex Srinivasan et al. 2021) TaxID=1111454 RepID=U7UIF5_9FIRM|nr:hypothetical protein HMPREF1250_1915 [Megasphaera vaginalis (ex Srinivasan et al. 2021)]